MLNYKKKIGLEFNPILFFVLLIHFSYDSIFKRIKKLGSVYFSVSYFKVRMVKITQINFKNIFKICSDSFNVSVSHIKNSIRL